MKSIIILLAVLTGFPNGLFAQEEVDTIWTRQYPDIYDAVITPDDSKVIVAIKGSIQVLDAQSGELIHTFEGTSTSGNELAVSSNSKYLYSHDFVKWDLENYEEVDRTTLSHPNAPGSMALSSDDSKLYYTNILNGQLDNAIIVVSTSSMEETMTATYNAYPTGLELSGNNNYLVLSKYINLNGLDFGIIDLLDANTLEPLETIYEGEIGVSDMKFTSGSENLYFSIMDMVEYDIQTKESTQKTNGERITSFQITKDENNLIVNSKSDFKARIFKTKNFELLGKINLPIDNIESVTGANKILLSNSYYIYFVDINSILTGINTIFTEDIILLNNEIHFKSNQIQIVEIYDYLGNRYFSGNFNPDEEVNIDLTGLEGGCYFLTIITGQSIQTIKFIRG